MIRGDMCHWGLWRIVAKVRSNHHYRHQGDQLWGSYKECLEELDVKCTYPHHPLRVCVYLLRNCLVNWRHFWMKVPLRNEQFTTCKLLHQILHQLENSISAILFVKSHHMQHAQNDATSQTWWNSSSSNSGDFISCVGNPLLKLRARFKMWSPSRQLTRICYILSLLLPK